MLMIDVHKKCNDCHMNEGWTWCWCRWGRSWYILIWPHFLNNQTPNFSQLESVHVWSVLWLCKMLTGLINTDLPVSCQSWLTVSNHPCLRSDKIIMLLHTHSSHSWFNLTRSMSPHNGDQKLRKCLKRKKVTNRISVCKNEPPKFAGKFLIIFCLQNYVVQ